MMMIMFWNGLLLIISASLMSCQFILFHQNNNGSVTGHLHTSLKEKQITLYDIFLAYISSCVGKRNEAECTLHGQEMALRYTKMKYNNYYGIKPNSLCAASLELEYLRFRKTTLQNFIDQNYNGYAII